MGVSLGTQDRVRNRLAWRNFYFIGDVSFLASKTYEIHENTFITVKVLGGISFHVMAEN